MTRSLARWLQASALAALAACAETPQAPPEIPSDIRVLDPFAYPGGDVRVRSAAFLSAPPDSVFADSLVLPVWSVADSTLTVRAPELRGTYQLRAKWLGQGMPLGSVQVTGGFREARFGPAGGPDVIAWGAPGAPAVLANGDSLLQLVVLGTGTVRTTFPDSIHSVRSMRVPGPTTQAGVFVLSGKVSTPGQLCGRHRAWRLWPTVALVDSAPSYIGYYSAAHSAPTTCIFLVHHEIIVYAAGSRTDEWGWGSADALRMSPRGDRVAVLGGGSFANASALPIFDARTGAVVYRVDAIRSDGGGAAFSDDGDTLWAAGTDSATGTWRLFSLESATGRVLAESDSLRWNSDDIAIDLSRPYLYVAGTYFPTDDQTCPIPLVRIFDRRTLRLVSTLLPAAGTPCVWLGQPQRLLVDPWAHRLYEVGGDGHRLVIYTYDLLPR